MIGFAVLLVLLPHELQGDDTKRFVDIERLLHDGELSDTPLLARHAARSRRRSCCSARPSARPERGGRRDFNVFVVARGAALAVSGLLPRPRPTGSLLRRTLLVLLFAVVR